jgi:hypothetical protein
LKVRVDEAPLDADADSLGAIVSDATGVEFDPMHHDDKKEAVLLSHAVFFNLLVNGIPFDDGFKGPFNTEKLMRNINGMKAIFTDAVLSDDLKAEMRSPVKNQPYMPQLCAAGYLLGPIAWSLATDRPLAQELWTRFLNTCGPGMIDDLYKRDTGAGAHHHDKNVKKYSHAWERVQAYVAAQAGGV